LHRDMQAMYTTGSGGTSPPASRRAQRDN
jgi:hypothetical protein